MSFENQSKTAEDNEKAKNYEDLKAEAPERLRQYIPRYEEMSDVQKVKALQYLFKNFPVANENRYLADYAASDLSALEKLQRIKDLQAQLEGHRFADREEKEAA